MTFLNFSDYLQSQLNRDVKSEDFSKFILNQRLMKVGKRSEMNANNLYYFENDTDVILNGENVISGDRLEFHSCDKDTIYYAVMLPEGAMKQKVLLKAEVDKATVAQNLIFLIKRLCLIEVESLEDQTEVAFVNPVEEVYA